MVSLQDLISADFYRNAIFLWMNSGSSYRPPDEIWITEIAGCLRRAYLERVEPVKYEHKQCVVMFLGQAIHEKLARVLTNLYGEIFEVEVEARTVVDIDGELIRIVGRADIVCRRLNVVIEVKTCGEIPSRPYTIHVRQLQYYLNLLGINNGVLLYFSRDGDLRAFAIKRDRGYEEEMIQRARALYYCLKRGRPPRPEKIPFLCNTCPYRIMGKCKPA